MSNAPKITAGTVVSTTKDTLNDWKLAANIKKITKMATNNPAESPFASLTQQLQSFGRLLGIHASAVGHARINGDFKQDPKDASNDGAYFKLSQNKRDSLLSYTLYASPLVLSTNSMLSPS